MAYEIQNKNLVFYHIRIQSSRKFLLLLKQNLDVTKELCVSNCKSWQTCYLRTEEEEQKNLKSNYYGNITTICFRKKDGDIRYLTPLNIDEQTEKKYCRFKKSELNTSIIKNDFLLKFVNEQGKFFLVV
jgi:hypothetical protein